MKDGVLQHPPGQSEAPSFRHPIHPPRAPPLLPLASSSLPRYPSPLPSARVPGRLVLGELPLMDHVSVKPAQHGLLGSIVIIIIILIITLLALVSAIVGHH